MLIRASRLDLQLRICLLGESIEYPAEQVERQLNAHMVAGREQVEQQTVQNRKHQGGRRLAAPTVLLRRSVTAGNLAPAAADCCMPPSIAGAGLVIEQANHDWQPFGDALRAKTCLCVHSEVCSELLFQPPVQVVGDGVTPPADSRAGPV